MKKAILFIIFLLCIVFFLLFVFFESLSLRGNKSIIASKALRLKGEKQGIVVTIDLCPSSKPYEKRLFACLDALGPKKGHAIPIYVCVSGKWILGHKKELEEIGEYKYLFITWVNHSYSHPIEKGFMDNPNVNFTQEVEANIKLMQDNDLITSQYFRFPGLVHNPERLSQLKALGYQNLDADAWLGKGQPIKDGSIILIHGNGNESPKVISDFIHFLKGYSGEIRNL